MRKRLLFARLLFCVVMLGSGTGLLEAGSLPPIAGQRYYFSKLPKWTNSGAWGLDGELLIVDVLADKILRFSDTGKFRGELPSAPGEGAIPHPTIIHQAGPRDYWVEDEDGRFVLLGDGYRVLDTKDLRALVSGEAGNLRAVYQWAIPGDGKAFFIFGDIRKGPDAFSAIIRVDMDRPASFKVLQRIELDDPGRRFYLLGSPLLAATGEDAYYLVMDVIPFFATNSGKRIFSWRIVGRGDQNGPLERPELPSQKGMAATELIFRSVEKSFLPSGVYSWNGNLYLLMREPTAAGAISWWLSKFNSVANRVEWTRRIESSSNHLLVVPGKKYWAFVEKGPVEGPGQQKVETFIRVPSSDLR